MADNSHLKWGEYKDFSKGLWSASSSFLMPADALQTMTDCYPQPGGGVRAFFKPVSENISAITTTHRYVAMGTFIDPVNSPYGQHTLILTRNTSTGVVTAWRRAPGASTFSSSKVFAAPSDGFTCVGRVAQYVDSSYNQYFVVGLGGFSTDNGVWLLNIATGTWTKISTSATGFPVMSYQSRLLANTNPAGALGNRLIWTDPGGVTYPADNYLDLFSDTIDAGNQIVDYIAYSPTNLLVATLSGGWWNIDGDIEDPVVREMGKGNTPAKHQHMARTDQGAVFGDPKSGVFLSQNMGAEFQRLDNQLDAWDYSNYHANSFAAHDQFVFCPGGHVYDGASQSWFTLSEASGSNLSYIFHNQPYIAGPGSVIPTENQVLIGVYALQHKDSGKILRFGMDDDDGTRYETYTVKTAPLQAGDGRQSAIREVELMVKSFHASSTVAVTVGSDTRTSNAIPVGTNVIRMTFRQRAEYLDVQVVPNSNVTDTEAPIIEGFRVGFQDGHNVRLL